MHANQAGKPAAKRRTMLPQAVGRPAAKDRAYFEALVDEIKTGGTEAFVADMLATELGDWHPRNDVPETEGLAMQKQESARLELDWLWNILEEGALPETMLSYTVYCNRAASTRRCTLARPLAGLQTLRSQVAVRI
jgi:hypothetical protein